GVSAMALNRFTISSRPSYLGVFTFSRRGWEFTRRNEGWQQLATKGSIGHAEALRTASCSTITHTVGRSNHERAVAFFAPWRLITVPEQKQRSSHAGRLATLRPRVAAAVAVLRELRAASCRNHGAGGTSQESSCAANGAPET